MADHCEIDAALASAEHGQMLSTEHALALAGCNDIPRLVEIAERLCIAGHGFDITYSRKVFIPLTQLCRDVCGYCTFAGPPRAGRPAFLTPDEVIEIARRGAEQGCKEALFTLGDKPELRYAAARDALAKLGHATTLSYLEACARLVLRETGLLPHINAGVMDEAAIARLRQVSLSQGLMLESASERLSLRGGPHFGSPDKAPAARLAMIEAAGRARVPFTTGILIGIGETRRERIEALLAIRELHRRHGHIQEVIIQNFRAKPATRMADAAEPSLDEQVWSIAVARLVLGAAMSIQSPPNLQPLHLERLVAAGINDWGGVSPVTPDHVNPEAPWPVLQTLERASERAGRRLTERLTIYPDFAIQPQTWAASETRTALLRLMDAAGHAREDAWTAGSLGSPPAALISRLSRETLPTQRMSFRHASPGPSAPTARSAGHAPPDTAGPPVQRILDQVRNREPLSEGDLTTLFAARGTDFTAVCRTADRLREAQVGDTVSYVVNRNINYTNICTYGCKFCAFSKGRHNLGHRDTPYALELSEIAERTREAVRRGATEICLQGGIKPGYTGDTYLSIVAAVKAAAADVHVHAFSPLEIWHGARTLDLSLRDYLLRLKQAGLSSLPGTAAEILDDEVRAVLCPDKITTAQWLEVMETAHEIGLRSTATIMFGHVDRYRHWARHILRVRALQQRTGGFTEFVPLAFVHMEAPIYLKGEARKGPTFREALLMHAVARLALSPLIQNIQASWVKMGPEGAAACLAAGANDVGGVLMNESITRAAGAAHGQELTADALGSLIRAAGRTARQRSTTYGSVDTVPHRPTQGDGLHLGP